jgi:hypothetical protein
VNSRGLTQKIKKVSRGLAGKIEADLIVFIGKQSYLINYSNYFSTLFGN